MAKPYASLPWLIKMLSASGGTISKSAMARLLATLQQIQQNTPSPTAPASPLSVVGSGAGAVPSVPTEMSGSVPFMKYFYPITDTIGVAAGIGGRIANAIYKSKAAKQIARGNAPQHLAAALTTPQSQKIFGNPLGELTKVSADAGQAAATKSLAKGEAWQGSLQDISNFISSVNTMRRLMSGNVLTAGGMLAVQRMLTMPPQRSQ